jgi:hypothetical protein
MTPNHAARAITLLVTVRDELELAGRPPGELVAITRQVQESLLTALRVAAGLIREMAEETNQHQSRNSCAAGVAAGLSGKMIP